jgi:hypothetical protein
LKAQNITSKPKQIMCAESGGGGGSVGGKVGTVSVMV